MNYVRLALIAALLLATGPAMGQAYVIDLVREGTWDYACTDGETVLSAHQREDTAATSCGGRKAQDPEGTYYVVAARKRVELAEVGRPDPPTEPDPPAEPDPLPTASCGEPYRGIPDPCAALGFDVWADYPADQMASGRDLSCTGTAADPCVIDATGVTFRGRTTLSGAYVILQGGRVEAGTGNDYWFRSRCTHCVIRDLEVAGPGVDAGHSSAVGLSAFNVWIRGSIHGFGDNRQDAREQDYHGIKAMGSDLWILDAEIYDVSGDSIQCGDASRGSCERVYIGGGYFHHNRENAIDIKDSRDVVVSGVTMEGFRPTASSPGEALIVHDDAVDARIYDNVIRDSTLGIVSSGLRGHVIEGNDIQALRKGIELRNTRDLTVRGNTISAPECVDVQGGTSGDIQRGC